MPRNPQENNHYEGLSNSGASFHGDESSAHLLAAARSVIRDHKRNLAELDYKKPKQIIIRAATREQKRMDELRSRSLADIVRDFDDFNSIENPNWRGWRKLAGAWAKR